MVAKSQITSDCGLERKVGVILCVFVLCVELAALQLLRQETGGSVEEGLGKAPSQPVICRSAHHSLFAKLGRGHVSPHDSKLFFRSFEDLMIDVDEEHL